MTRKKIYFKKVTFIYKLKFGHEFACLQRDSEFAHLMFIFITKGKALSENFFMCWNTAVQLFRLWPSTSLK